MDIAHQQVAEMIQTYERDIVAMTARLVRTPSAAGELCLKVTQGYLQDMRTWEALMDQDDTPTSV